MLDIIFTACQILNPEICDTVRLADAYEDKEIVQCFSQSQTKIADFLRLHEGWAIKRYGCIRSDGKET